MNRLIALFTIFSFFICLSLPGHSQAKQRQGSFFSSIFSSKSDTKIQQGDFSLNKQFNIVTDIKDKQASALSDRLYKFLSKKGIEGAMQTQTIGQRNIIIKQVERIEAHPQVADAFMVQVSKNKIVIHFTSSLSAMWAYSALKMAFEEKHVLMGKVSKVHFTSLSLSDTQGSPASSKILDMTNIPCDITSAKKKIETYFNENVLTVYLLLVAEQGWKIQSDVMHLVNPNQDICTQGGYSYRQLNDLNNQAIALGIELIPILDFSSPKGDYFNQVTGHNKHSVEGLRFTKAFVDEFCKNTSFEIISIGFEVEDQDIKRKYITPLVDVVQNNNKKAIIN